MQASPDPVSNLGSEEAEEALNDVICAENVFECLLSRLEKQNQWQHFQISSGISEVNAEPRPACRSPFPQSPPPLVFWCPPHG